MSPNENLAAMKPQVYKDPRPAEYFQPFHERLRRRPPDWFYDFVRLVLTPYILGAFRSRSLDVGNIPTSGPVILAPNHFSFLDHFFLACFTRRKVCFMAKSQLYKPPLTFVLRHGGVFPVRRGFRDEETFITAKTVLARGGCIAMYCEGGRSRTGTLSREVRPGIGRLALESGAPIVPVAIHGSAAARNWKRFHFPSVTVKYGRSIRWEKRDATTRPEQQLVANSIFEEIKQLYYEVDELKGSGRPTKPDDH